MENEDRPFRWLADIYRTGYEAYVRFWCDFYGAAAADLAYQTSRDAPEEAPERAS